MTADGFGVLSSVDVQSAILFVTALTLYWYLYKRDNDHSNLPPGPKGWPLLGNLLSLSLHSEKEMCEWSKKYGPVCRLNMAGYQFVLLGSMEAVEEAFVRKSDIFSDRLQNIFPGLSGDKGIIFLNYNSLLKEQRRFGLATLREFRMGRRSLEPCILQQCTELCDEIEKRCDSGEPFEVDILVGEAISAVISFLIFNKNLPKENEEFRNLLHHIVSGTKYGPILAFTVFCPYLKLIPPFSWGVNESEKQYARALRMIQEQIDDHKATRDPNEPRDFIDCFLNEMDNVKNSPQTGFTDAQLQYTVRDLFVAGSETTSTTIRWMILFLCQYPEIQAKLQKEIDEVFGSARPPSINFIEKMPFTKGVIQEVLRLRPIIPIGVPHVAAKEGTIMGYRIPQGTIVASNMYRIHHDENVWANPEKFDPSRHIDRNGKFSKSSNVMPFSIGSRQCLGMQLAEMELFLVVLSLFQRFSFQLFEGKDIDMRGMNVIALRPYPFKVSANRR